MAVFLAKSSYDLRDEIGQSVGVGSALGGQAVGTLEPCGGDHLHRAGQRADFYCCRCPISNFTDVCHLYSMKILLASYSRRCYAIASQPTAPVTVVVIVSFIETLPRSLAFGVYFIVDCSLSSAMPAVLRRSSNTDWRYSCRI